MALHAWVTALTVALGCLLAALGLRAGGLSGGRLLRHALAFGPGIGLGLASLQLFFWRLLGLGRPGLAAFLGAVAATAAGIAAWGVRRGTAAAAARGGVGRQSGARVPAARARLALQGLAFAALLLSAVSLLGSFRAFSRAWPDGAWDAVAIWNSRARFLFRGYEEAPALIRRLEPTSHPHYPLLLPGAIAAQQGFAGGESPEIARATGLAFLAGLGLLALAIAADSGRTALGALAAAFLWSTPMVLKWGFAQVADVPLAYYFLGAVAVLAAQLRDRKGGRLPPVLGGLFLGLVAWTKNEGMLMALLVLGLGAAWWLLRRRSGAGVGGAEDAWGWRPLGAVALGAAPGLAAAFLFKGLWAPESGLDTFLQGELLDRVLSLERWWNPVREVLLRLVPLGGTYGWDLAWPALGAGACLAVGVHLRARARAGEGRGRLRRLLPRGSWASFWGAAVLLTMTSWIPIFVVTPYEQAWHIAGSLDRLLLHVYPLAVCGVLLRLGEALAEGGPSPPRSAR